MSSNSKLYKLHIILTKFIKKNYLHSGLIVEPKNTSMEPKITNMEPENPNMQSINHENTNMHPIDPRNWEEVIHEDHEEKENPQIGGKYTRIIHDV